MSSATGSETPTPLSRAVEALDWLEDYHADMFNVCCLRCGAPFKSEHYAIAAPAEWFGVLDDYRQLALDVIALTRSVGLSESAATPKESGLQAVTQDDEAAHPTEGTL